MFEVYRNGLCYKEIIIQRNYKKMTIIWSFSYNFFVKFQARNIWDPQYDCYIQISIITRCVIKGLYCLFYAKSVEPDQLISKNNIPHCLPFSL